jgi:mannose-6-phosphate isomerase-like protein (cupin superfamily)
MDTIIIDGSTAAYLIRGSMAHDKTSFLTPADLELQVGFVVYPAGGVIVPHRHVPITRKVERTCEVIVVREGRCDVDFYNDRCELSETREMQVGDVLISLGGGHGFRMREDTVLLEIKQGPYFGESEKESLK